MSVKTDPVAALSCDDEQLAEIAANGHAEFKAAHTWGHRATRLLEWIGLEA